MPVVEQLTDPDLRLPQARPERRAEPRWPCRRGHICHLLVRPSLRKRHAFITDLSFRGIGLILPERLELGTVLALQLPHVRPELTCIHLARVVHARRNQEWGWSHGCRLYRPLEEEELADLT